MKVIYQPSFLRDALNLFLGLSLLALVPAVHAQQQSQIPSGETAGADAVQRRVTRARALAAVGKLAAAAAELESLRASTSDESVRDVARILLVGIFVEMPDYTRATALLEEAYTARSARSESAARSYYALAGQTVRSVRAHVERYRTFGINVADEELPMEAKGDLEQLRTLLERVHAQAKSIREEEESKGRAGDATALIEDSANARLRLARGADDRARWEQEISDARQRLVASETRIGKISEAPVVQTASINPVLPGIHNSYAPSASANASADSGGRTKPAAKDQATAEAAKSSAAPVQQQSAPAPMPSEQGGEQGNLVSVGALNARAEKKVDPSYPQFAKMARISGVVTLHVVVDEKGVVESIEKADGPQVLQAAAADAVRRWRFKPTVIDGQPVRVSGYINFNFSL